MLSWKWCPTCSNCSEGRPNTWLHHRSRMLRLAFVTLVCGLLVAQQAAPPPQEVKPGEPTQDELRIPVSVDFVTTHALVFDRDGHYVNGLQSQDFRLFDNGKQQNIAVDVMFVPISLVICIQSNAHVQGLLPQVS